MPAALSSFVGLENGSSKFKLELVVTAAFIQNRSTEE
jgi:hypothetical protein